MKNVMYATAILILLLLFSCKKEAFSKTNTLYEGYVDFTDFYGNHICVQEDFKYETNTYRKKGRQYTMNYLTFDNDTLDIVISFYYNHSKNEVSNATIQLEESGKKLSGENILPVKGINENGELFFGAFEYDYPEQAPTVPTMQAGSMYFRPKK